ncbi:MAG: DUF502 domain-containing protein [Chloroflexi bacterium]|nr:DUF502 domain-containing protein [Chloroflexota bacterium]
MAPQDKKQPRSTINRRLQLHIQGRLFAGLVFVIPIAVTFLIFSFALNILKNLLGPLPAQIGDRFPSWFPEQVWLPLLSVLLSLVILYLFGLAVQNFIGKRLIRWGNALVDRVPFIRAVYSVARQATDLFSGANTSRYSRVVLVDFPRLGMKSIGFVTGYYRDPAGERWAVVYLPTAPTPQTGFMVFVKEDQIVDAGLSVDAAMRMVLTAGLLSEEMHRPSGAGPSQQPSP